MEFGHYQRREGKESASESSGSDRSSGSEKYQRRFYDPHDSYGYETVRDNPDSAYNTVKQGVAEWNQREKRREMGRDLRLGQPEQPRIIENRQLGRIIGNIRKNYTLYDRNDISQLSEEHDLNMALVDQGNFAALTNKMNQWKQSENPAMKHYAQDFFVKAR